jgi:hypothetical protein
MLEKNTINETTSDYKTHTTNETTSDYKTHTTNETTSDYKTHTTNERISDYKPNTSSKVILTNQNASNGVIHVIDRAMYPLPDNTLLQYVAMQPNLSQLVYSVIRANLQAELAGK